MIGYCGKVELHDYQLYLAINDIDHTKTKSMSLQTNGICERCHKTIFAGILSGYVLQEAICGPGEPANGSEQLAVALQ